MASWLVAKLPDGEMTGYGMNCNTLIMPKGHDAVLLYSMYSWFKFALIRGGRGGGHKKKKLMTEGESCKFFVIVQKIPPAPLPRKK